MLGPATRDRVSLLRQDSTEEMNSLFSLPKSPFPSEEDFLLSSTDPWRHLENEAAFGRLLVPSAEPPVLPPRPTDVQRTAEDTEKTSSGAEGHDFQKLAAVSNSAQRRDVAPVGDLTRQGTRTRPERGSDDRGGAGSQELLVPSLRRYLAFTNTECASAIAFIEDTLSALVIAATSSEDREDTPRLCHAAPPLSVSSPLSPSVPTTEGARAPPRSPSQPPSVGEKLEHRRRLLEAFYGKSAAEIARDQAIAVLTLSRHSRLEEACSLASSAVPGHPLAAALPPKRREEEGRKGRKTHGGKSREEERQEEENTWYNEAVVRHVEAAAQAGEVAESLSVEILEGGIAYYERRSPFHPGYPLICRRKLPGRPETDTGEAPPSERRSPRENRDPSESPPAQATGSRWAVWGDECYNSLEFQKGGRPTSADRGESSPSGPSYPRSLRHSSAPSCSGGHGVTARGANTRGSGGRRASEEEEGRRKGSCSEVALEQRQERPALLTLADVLRLERHERRKLRETRAEQESSDNMFSCPLLLEPPGVWTALDVLQGEEQLIDVGWLTTRAKQERRPGAFSEDRTSEKDEEKAKGTPHETRGGECRIGALKVFEEASLLGYTRCLDSSDRYTLHFKDLLSAPRFPGSFSGSSVNRLSLPSRAVAKSHAVCGQTGEAKRPLRRFLSSSSPWEYEELPGVSLGFVKDFEFFPVGEPSEILELSLRRRGLSLVQDQKCERETTEPGNEEEKAGAPVGASCHPRLVGCMYTSVDRRTGRAHMLRRILLIVHPPCESSSSSSSLSPLSLGPPHAPCCPSLALGKPRRNAETLERHSGPRLELLRDEVVLDLSDDARWGAMHLALGKTADGRFFTICATSRSRTATWILSAKSKAFSLFPKGETLGRLIRPSSSPTAFVSRGRHLLLFDVSQHNALSAFSLPLAAVLGRKAGDFIRELPSPSPASLTPVDLSAPASSAASRQAPASHRACSDSSSDPRTKRFIPLTSSSQCASSCSPPDRESSLSASASALRACGSTANTEETEAKEVLRARPLFHFPSFIFTDLDSTADGIAVYGLRPPSLPVVFAVDFCDPPKTDPQVSLSSPPLDSRFASSPASEICSSSPALSALSPSPSALCPRSSFPQPPGFFPFGPSAAPASVPLFTQIPLSMLASSSGVGILQPGVNDQFSALRFSLQSPFEPFLQCSLDLRTKCIRVQRLHAVDRDLLRKAASAFLRFFPSLASSASRGRLAESACRSSALSSSWSVSHGPRSSTGSYSESPLPSESSSASPAWIPPPLSSSSSLSSSAWCFSSSDHAFSGTSVCAPFGVSPSLAPSIAASEAKAESPFSRDKPRNDAAGLSECESAEKRRHPTEAQAASGDFQFAEGRAVDDKAGRRTPSREQSELGNVEVVSFPSRDGKCLIPVTLLLPSEHAAVGVARALSSEAKKRATLEAKSPREACRQVANQGRSDRRTLPQMENRASGTPSFTVSIAPFSSRFASLSSPSPSASLSSSSFTSSTESGSAGSLSSRTVSCVCSPLTSSTAGDFAFRFWSSSPLLVLAYGAYKRPMAVSFSPMHLVLLSLGWRVAFVHCRGEGAAEGETRDNGRGLRKHQTVDDLEDAINGFVALNVAERKSIFLKTSSAGGILGGAFLAFQKMRHQVHGVVLQHGFFDVLSAMQHGRGSEEAMERGSEHDTKGDNNGRQEQRSEESYDALRALEEEEWGNPNRRGTETDEEGEERRAHLANLLSFSPYSNFHPPRGFVASLAEGYDNSLADDCKRSLRFCRGPCFFSRDACPCAPRLSRLSEKSASAQQAKNEMRRERPATRKATAPRGGDGRGEDKTRNPKRERLGAANGENGALLGGSGQMLYGEEADTDTGMDCDSTETRQRAKDGAFSAKQASGEGDRYGAGEFPALFLSTSLGDSLVRPWHSAKLLGKVETMRRLGRKRRVSLRFGSDAESDRPCEALFRKESCAGDWAGKSGVARPDRRPGDRARDASAEAPVKEADRCTEDATRVLGAAVRARREERVAIWKRTNGSHSRGEGRASGEMEALDGVDRCAKEKLTPRDFVLFKLGGDAEGHSGSANSLHQFRGDAEELCFFYHVLQMNGGV
ncbi:conserved hypothetical protein [Neospora caninum Liverpool]|uniref:Prolyl endopeptidase-like n=1 Tax=Neospora caninum (strain Liverpool) TaxID=572307 RepID=F0VPN9_NEOCL|nr:conserved hypothetical protein [Neospora caninum Liverpool]CBZ55686.1 conserved hypothetical protein [Neospora caninum Liverpool]|eukprot:XP_003885712.1 conserved hypothetical protein [Neospora caninum Liverpool]